MPAVALAGLVCDTHFSMCCLEQVLAARGSGRQANCKS